MKLVGCSNTYLPVEIIEQIILQLPPKSIGRWRCVSKKWRGLLCSPKFIKAHAIIMQAQSVSIFTYTSCMRLTLTNDGHVTASGAHHNLQIPRSTYIRGFCDGLVLVSENASKRFLINPTTGHTRKIPIPRRTRINLMCTLDGIGFDSVTNDYKVVSIYQIYNYKDEDDSNHEMLVQIYSVNDGAWKSCTNLPNFVGHRFCHFWPKGVFVERCIHWVVRRDTDGIDIIIAFDVVEEKLCQVPNPTHPLLKYNMIGVLAGCLCVSTMIEGYINVWVMKKYGIQESWTRIAGMKTMKKGWFVPLCLVGQQNLVLEEYHKGKLKKLVSYNLADKMFKDVDIVDGIRDQEYRTIPLAETMVSPYGMRG